MVAAAIDPVKQLYEEPLLPQPVPARPIRIRQSPRRNWVKWALVLGLVIAVAVTVELLRIRSQNAIRYDTVAAERGAIQASVTATGTVNAVVDVQVGSQVSGNIKALYGVTPDYLTIRDLSVADGAEFTQQDIESANKVAVLGKTPVSNLFGDADPIGQTIRITARPWAPRRTIS